MCFCFISYSFVRLLVLENFFFFFEKTKCLFLREFVFCFEKHVLMLTNIFSSVFFCRKSARIAMIVVHRRAQQRIHQIQWQCDQHHRRPVAQDRGQCHQPCSRKIIVHPIPHIQAISNNSNSSSPAAVVPESIRMQRPRLQPPPLLHNSNNNNDLR